MNLPLLLSMKVLCVTRSAIYLRLPAELQESTSCSCPQCKANPSLQKWDTLGVPLSEGATSWRLHMPDGSVEAMKEYDKRQGDNAVQYTDGKGPQGWEPVFSEQQMVLYQGAAYRIHYVHSNGWLTLDNNGRTLRVPMSDVTKQ